MHKAIPSRLTGHNDGAAACQHIDSVNQLLIGRAVSETVPFSSRVYENEQSFSLSEPFLKYFQFDTRGAAP